MNKDNNILNGRVSPVARWWGLAGAGEPYRILFLLGLALGMFGVLLWPAFVWGGLPFYPGILHARIMVQGFVFCFIAGFLGSALPHMLEVRGMTLGQTLVLSAMIAGSVAGHAAGWAAAGDAGFAVSVLSLVVSVLRRWPERKDLPPPGFILVAMGLFSGFAGGLCLTLQSWWSLPLWVYTLGRLLLNEAFILFPVLGAGSYLLPRMLGLPNRHLITPKAADPTPAWMARACFMGGVGLVLLAGIALETVGWIRAAFLLRATAVTGGLLHELPLYRVRQIRGSIPWALLIAMISLLAGYWILALFPQRYMTYAHVVFISGFGLLVLNIAARVMLGHSGNTDLIYARSAASKWITGLVLLAMATRVSADLLPRMQWSHYAYAAITWVVLSLIWLMIYGPLTAEGPETEA